MNPLKTVKVAIFVCFTLLSYEAGALTLSLSTDSLDASFTGHVEATITNPGGTGGVRLELVVDFNGNGSADATEAVVHQIQLTDGVRMMIGGVRNWNVSGDEDGAVNGTIQTRLRLAQLPEFGRLAGKYVWRATASEGAAQEKAFTITQSETGQKISGTVTSNGSAAGYAAVVLLDATVPDGEPVGGVFADSNGNYTVKVVPGTYMVIPTRVGLVTRLDDAAMVEVSAGQQRTANLTLETATRTISGVVRKAGGGAGLAGMQIFVEDESAGVLAIAVTGTNGQFSIPVLPGIWMVEVSERQLISHGLLGPSEDQHATTSAGNAENVVVELSEPTALIHGTLKTVNNQPLAAIGIRAWKSPLEASGLTDAEGRYVVGVGAGQWWLAADEDQMQALGLFVNGPLVTIVAGQAVETNLVATPLNATISGRLIDANGAGIADATLVVQPEPFQGGSAVYPVTEADGSFQAVVYGGTWNIAMECNEALARGYVNTYTNVTVAVNGTVSGVVPKLGNAMRQINGTVKDENLNAVVGIQVDAWANINGVNYYVGCGETDQNGTYLLGVMPGTWNVTVSAFELQQRGYEPTLTQQVTVSGGPVTVDFTARRPGPIGLNNARRLSDGRFQFEVSGRAGDTYVVEGSSTLAPNGWSDVSMQVATSGLFTITINEPAQTHRFYRLRKL